VVAVAFVAIAERIDVEQAELGLAVVEHFQIQRDSVIDEGNYYLLEPFVGKALLYRIKAALPIETLNELLLIEGIGPKMALRILIFFELEGSPF
jgi:hypothetical protein